MKLIHELSLEVGATIKYFNKEESQFLRDGMKFTVNGEDYLLASDDNSETQTENIMYHEIGHSFYGHKHHDCYAFSLRSKQEKEAHKYMIEQRADQWLATYDWEPRFIDYDAFMKHFEIDNRLYNLVVDVFDEILGNSQSDTASM